jgi:cardiolipin synthase
VSEIETTRETTSRPSTEQDRPTYTAADAVTLARLPLAVAFPLADHPGWRIAILAGAGVTDLLDGPLARRFGGSRFGALLDPIADKLFMAAAFGVVAFSGRLEWYELVGILLRDIIATVAFAVTFLSHRPRAIPARLGGKAVTVAQMLTLLAFLVESPYLRPMAWATAAIALYAIWDYVRVAPVQGRRVGG